MFHVSYGKFQRKYTQYDNYNFYEFWTGHYNKFYSYHLVKEIPTAFNTSAATSKEFEGEYDFKRPPKKEKDRKKTIVLVSDCIFCSTLNETKLEDDNKLESQVW